MSEFKYICKFCNYSTDKRQAWYQHNRGSKHKKKEEKFNEKKILDMKTNDNFSVTKPLYNNALEQFYNSSTSVNDSGSNEIKKYICEYCGNSFTHSTSYYRHKKNYCKNENNLKKKIKQQELQEMERKLEEQRKLEAQRKLEDERKEMERKLEEQRKLEAQRKLEDDRKEMERKLEEQRKLDEHRKLEEQRQSDQKELLNFLIETQKRQEEERRLEKEEQRKREEKLMELIISQKMCQGDSDGSIDEKIEKGLDKIMKAVESHKKIDQSHNTNNSGTYFEAQTQNNLLNNLNLNYNNVISMNQFLYNMEHVNKIPRSDLEAIAFASANCSEADLADTIHKTIEKNCIEQTKGIINPADGLELLPVMPVVCSDGNCRSHKEKVNEFWETVYGDKHFDQMLNIIDKRLYEVLQKKIYLEEYGKKKLFKKIKRKNTIHDMKSMQEKVNGDSMEKKFRKTL
jgi:hypothetical protein